MRALPLTEAAVAWAAGRGISRRTLEAVGAASGIADIPPDGKEVGRKAPAIVFPYRRGGDIVNFKARALSDKRFHQQKDGELRLFNLDEVLAGPGERVFITEGEMDALALIEAGIPLHEVVSVPNGSPTRGQQQAPEATNAYRYVDGGLEEGLSRCRRFILVTDQDPPGLALRQDLARLLGAARCWFLDWPEGIKDANEMLQADGAQALREFVDAAPQPWPVAGLYSLSQMPEPEPLTVWRPGFPEWESKVGFAPTTVSVVTGHPGHGKSTLLMQAWHQIARDYGVNVAVASFETQAKPHHRRNIRSFMFGRRDTDLTAAERAEADRFNDAHFRWLVHPNRRPTLRWVLDTAEVAIVRENCRALVIDPWNRLENSRPDGQRETDYISACLDELLDFARDMNCHVQVVAHPAKAADPKHRKQHPALEDIAGSKAWDTKADLGLCVHRPKVFEDGRRCTEADVYVLKARYDELGYPCRLAMEYRLDEGRFVSTDYRVGPAL